MIGITGATGFMGMTHLAYFIRKNIKVRILVRPSHPWAESPPAGCRIVVGDLSDKESLRSFADGLSSCFHYAARANFKGDRDKFRQANTEGTKNLLEACLEVERFVFSSSQAVILRDENITEETESLPYPDQFIDHYGESKADAEKLCQQRHSGSSILRPGWVWGAGDTTNLPTLLKPALKKKMAFIDGGKNHSESTHIINFIDAANRVVKQDKTRGKIYFVTDDSPHQTQQFSNATLEACGLPACHRTVSSKLVKPLLKIGNNFVSKAINLPYSSFIYLTKEQTFSDQALQQDVGYAHPISQKEGLRDLGTWIKAVGGASTVCTGRRRGEAKELVERTWDYLLHKCSLFEKIE
ncbi:MAG: NAD-dependent epimerase/dehydratase family protein [Myxococcota bacterium]|nr:NAD-dependent epimerase/dehydratase family protein [Myxococcota bacterium]